MMSEQHLIRDVSDTAMWVAAYRAEESARPDALFRDPHAYALAGTRGREIASRVRGQAVRFGVVVRHAIIDRELLRALDAGGFDVVLNLAAGLDARPYRLELPEELVWIEADLPGVIEYKSEILTDVNPRCRLERVAVDILDRDARRGVIARAARAGRVLVVTEGLLGYLSPEDVASLAEDLRACAAVGEWLTDVTTAAMARSVRDAASELKGGQAPILFAPEDPAAFFGECGWAEDAFYDYFGEAPRLGRDTVAGKLVRGAMRVLPEARRRRLERAAGVVRLRPAP